MQEQTDLQKELLQMRHRYEEALARDRVRERKERTRRLIQQGDIVEKAMPLTNGMTLEELEGFLGKITKALEARGDLS
jgi:hypothetical protein